MMQDFGPETARRLHREIHRMPKSARRFAYNLIEQCERDVLTSRPMGDHHLQQPRVLVLRQVEALERALAAPK